MAEKEPTTEEQIKDLKGRMDELEAKPEPEKPIEKIRQFEDIKKYTLLKVLKLYVTSLYDDATKGLVGLLTDAQKTDLTDGGASTAHKHDHGGMDGLTHDDHTQYRLESADHNHQSTGAEGGKIDHGSALDGLGDNDHGAIYYTETEVDDLIAAATPKFSRGKTTGTAISDDTTTNSVITHGLGAVPVLIVVRTFPSSEGSRSASFGSAKTNGVSTILSEGCSYIFGTSPKYNGLQDGKISIYSHNGSAVVGADVIAVSSTTFTIQFASAAYSGAAGTPIFDWEVYA